MYKYKKNEQIEHILIEIIIDQKKERQKKSYLFLKLSRIKRSSHSYAIRVQTYDARLKKYGIRYCQFFYFFYLNRF